MIVRTRNMFLLLSAFILLLTTPARADEGLMLNVDCTTFFQTHHIPDGKAGETIDRYVDVYASAGVKTLLCNTNARRTNYRSRVWDAWWDGYDPAGPDDQPFFAAIRPEQANRHRKTIDSMLAFDRQDIDYPARFIARCRHNGVSPWITLRMNDCHYADNPAHPFHGDFWKKHPQYCINPKGGYFGQCLDYAHPEVRDYYRALIVETLDRYDIDGLELDFMREPFLFSDGKQAEGGAILTGWLGEIRKLVDAAAARRGHPMRLGVRVPSRPETAKAMGLDAVAWAKAGLVDLIVPTPRWATIEFDMPMERWRELLGESEATLAGGLEVLYRPYHAVTPRQVTLKQAAGAAAAVLARGADCVYLFNYFQDGHPDWLRADYLKTLNAMNSLDALRKMPRCVGVTYRDIRAAAEKYRPPLPASGKEIVLSLNPGPLPEENWDCLLSIAVEVPKAEQASPPQVSVGGKPCRLTSEKKEEKYSVFSYLVPRKALAENKAHEIKIDGAGRPLTVHRLELSFEK